jgi:type II secretory pathway pseudopilin PulG
LLDLPAPLFAGLDGLLSSLAAPTLRLALWGVIAAAVSMGVYWLLSPQTRIVQAKADALAARRALDAYDGEFATAWPLIGRVLRTAVRQLGLVTWPALLGSLPVLALLVWLSTAYGHAFPDDGADIPVRALPEAGATRAQPVPAEGGHQVVVLDDTGHVVERILLSAPVPTIHKRQWWNALVGNPIGYLPDSSPLEWIELGLPQREYLSFGPAWLRAWYVVFFGVLLAASLAIKVAARIE